ncbi:ParB/RepB/Spo0J family partition protein [Oscillibacter valericigenes]|uniref:ParB/RepB/Spo0J family partition protein n=1 Tax=Oscillibacter ruminantium TaxID=1263547 RepID=UPI0025AB0B98|nr:ParB/RepB/Spo0J family partition protein [Oscillibacter valericigenes]
MNETLRRLKESGAIDGTGSAITENLNDPNGLFESMFTPGPSKLAPPGTHGAKEISLDLIDPWRDAEHDAQPFKPYSADKLAELAENIRQNGVISPVRLRLSPFEKGRYQILAGHNRVAASRLAGRKTIPAIIMQATDDEAKLILIDSNLYQRDHLLPSEKAWAYKMRLDTIKQQGKRTDLTSVQLAPKLSTEQIGEESGISKDQVKRYIRLTYLASPLLDMVDTEAIPFTAGVSISFLSHEAQQLLVTVMADNDVKSITRSQGEELKAFRDALDEETILRIFGKSKRGAAVPKPQSMKLQVDYAPAMVRRLAKDEVLQAQLRAVIDAYVQETMR